MVMDPPDSPDAFEAAAAAATTAAAASAVKSSSTHPNHHQNGLFPPSQLPSTST